MTNNFKVIVDFTKQSVDSLGPVAQIIHDKMTTNASIFSVPPVTMPNLQTAIDDYVQGLVAKDSRAKADMIAFREARLTLTLTLGTLGNYVNTVAKGDIVLVEKSGFPNYSTSRAVDPSPPAAPQNVRMVQGVVSGTATLYCKPDRSRSSNELWLSTGDPNDAESFLFYTSFTGGRVLMEGLTPGAVVWVMVRTLGAYGKMGAWSVPTSIRVV